MFIQKQQKITVNFFAVILGLEVTLFVWSILFIFVHLIGSVNYLKFVSNTELVNMQSLSCLLSLSLKFTVMRTTRYYLITP